MERKALFLDRDGVINKNPPEHDYIKRWEDFEILPGVFESIKLAKDKGWMVIVISNQRGVARGLMTADVVKDIHEKLNQKLKEFGTNIDAFFWCGHDYSDHCECRKPKPGMIFQAAKQYNINLADSILIGDLPTDEQMGINAGVKTIMIPSNSSWLHIVQQIVQQND